MKIQSSRVRMAIGFALARLLVGISLAALCFASAEVGMAALLDFPTIAVSMVTGSIFGWPESIGSPLDPVFTLFALPTWFLIGYGIGVIDGVAKRSSASRPG